jgi:hypothetical protein
MKPGAAGEQSAADIWKPRGMNSSVKLQVSKSGNRYHSER